MKRNQLSALVAAALMSFSATQAMAADPQTTAFTYQGLLNAGGSLANGSYQFTFMLYDSETGPNVIAGPITQSIQVVNGVFTTDLDFDLVFNGTQYWLDIKVGSTSGNEQSLSGRQRINIRWKAQGLRFSRPEARESRNGS